jgi:hypothetical protein
MKLKELNRYLVKEALFIDNKAILMSAKHLEDTEIIFKKLNDKRP